MDILKMSDLQSSLIIIGIIIIIGVIIFNWVQQTRYRRKIQAAFDHKHDDVLLSMPNNKDSDERIEPLLNKNFSVDLPIDLQRSGELRPNIDNKKISVTSANDYYDDTTNYVVYIRSDSIIANIYIAKLLKRKFDFGKSVIWLGQKQKTDPWEEITIETNVDIDGYIGLKGCLQLADRAGSVSEVNLSKFRDLVHDFASQINGVAECPDIVLAHEKAVLLDRFCADVDVMIGINIISKDNGAFVGTKIRALAEASGFKLESDGIFKYRDDSNQILFTLNNYEPTQFLSENIKSLTTLGVTFLLDVPRVTNGERVFDQMTHLAKIFSNTLGGIMVDDNRVPLSDNGILRSKQQLIDIQSSMKKYKIIAGSPSALRLFS